jgi:hypothetical protein
LTRGGACTFLPNLSEIGFFGITVT